MRTASPERDLNRSRDYRLWILVSFLTVGTISPDIAPVQVAGLGLNQLVLYVISAYLALCAFFDGTVRYAFVGPALVILAIAIWSTISTLWSPVPLVSFMKGNTFVLNVFVGCFVASRLDVEHILKGLCVGIMIAVVLSALMALAMPSVAGTTPFHPGAWRGLYAQKNVLGRACMLAAIFLLTLHYLEADKSSRRRIKIGILIALIVLIQSQSITSIVGVIVFSILFPISRISFLYDIRVRIVSIILGIPFVIIMMNIINYASDQFLLMIGRSSDLTGRVPLWDYTLSQLETRFFIGYGLDGFFQPWNDGALLGALAWLPEHAHNGFLDMAIEIGVVAVVALVLALIWGFFLMPFIKGGGKYLSVLSLVVFLVLFLQNLTESNLYRSSNTIWIVFVVTLVKLWIHRASVKARKANEPFFAGRSPYVFDKKKAPV